jgi:hypothetical protein
MFGAAYIASLGYEGDTPEDPVMLLRLGERVLERIDEAKRPEPRFEGMTFEPELWKNKLTPPTTALKAALEKTATEEREAEQTLQAKHQAMQKYDAIFSKAAGLISALLRIAGEETLADKVRPTKSRPGRIADPEDEAPPSA